MIAEEPVIPSDARRHMCDGTYGGVAKEQVSSHYLKTVKHRIVYC